MMSLNWFRRGLCNYYYNNNSLLSLRSNLQKLCTDAHARTLLVDDAMRAGSCCPLVFWFLRAARAQRPSGLKRLPARPARPRAATQARASSV